MKEYSYKDCACKIYGLPVFDRTGEFRRFNDRLISLYPYLKDGDKRVCGARLRFRTDSPVFSVRFELDNIYPDVGMSFYQANDANVFAGIFPDSRYLGIVCAPGAYRNDYICAQFAKGNDNEDITVFFPRNPTVKNIIIGIEDGYDIYPPTPYKHEKPVLFYGSSITENGHTSASCAYTALLSRWLDTDYYNFGISGCARGEKETAEFLAGFDSSVFVLDYDHNAPTPEHLRNTHYDFYRIIREHRPALPILMLTRPARDTDDMDERFEIVRSTYDRATADGDKNVYLIDGRTYFDGMDAEICTTDRTHPNDLGHYLMAKKIYPLLDNLINKK